MAIFEMKAKARRTAAPQSPVGEDLETLNAELLDLRERRSAVWERFLRADRARSAAADGAAVPMAAKVARLLKLDPPAEAASNADALPAEVDDIDQQLEQLRAKISVARADKARADWIDLSPKWIDNRKALAAALVTIKRLCREGEALEAVARRGGLLGTSNGPVCPMFGEGRLLKADAKFFCEELARAGLLDRREIA
jgi:hypothetical protein